ncbi:MAG: glycerol transport system ATP-binding protein [Glaciecola sp.]
MFDEPLTVIDPHLKWKLRRKLKEIHEKLNITMIYVTHDQLEAATFADEIALMYEGKIVQFGTPQSLFDHPNHTFVGYFIGSPGMNFMEVSLQDGVLVNEQAQFRIAPELIDTLCEQCGEKANANIKVGIRPEFIQLVESATANSYSADVEFIEQLGNHQIVTIQFLQKQWHIRIGEHQQCDAKRVHFELPKAHLKLYLDEYLLGHKDEASQNRKVQSNEALSTGHHGDANG